MIPMWRVDEKNIQVEDQLEEYVGIPDPEPLRIRGSDSSESVEWLLLYYACLITFSSE